MKRVYNVVIVYSRRVGRMVVFAICQLGTRRQFLLGDMIDLGNIPVFLGAVHVFMVQLIERLLHVFVLGCTSWEMTGRPDGRHEEARKYSLHQQDKAHITQKADKQVPQQDELDSPPS
jgi:hypothetical protein